MLVGLDATSETAPFHRAGFDRCVRVRHSPKNQRARRPSIIPRGAALVASFCQAHGRGALHELGA